MCNTVKLLIVEEMDSNKMFKRVLRSKCNKLLVQFQFLGWSMRLEMGSQISKCETQNSLYFGINEHCPQGNSKYY